MRISELARRSGVPVPTIKYYLRENLLPAGSPTAPNQAVYDEVHLRRLRLIRILIGLGRCSVLATRELLGVLEDGRMTRGDLLAATHARLGPATLASIDEEDRRVAAGEVAALVQRLGWQVCPDAPALGRLADVVAALRTLDLPDRHGALERYAEVANRLAEGDLRAIAAPQDGADAREAVVVATVLGEAMLYAVYALARESAGARMLTAPGATRA